MQILKKISELNKPCVLAMGTFDGFHLGHQVVLRRAQELAQTLGRDFALLTFANHPLACLRPGQEPGQLMSLEQRRQYCAEAGVEKLVEIEFNREFAALSPEIFARQVEQHLVVVGEDFTFGQGGSGDFRLFKQAEVCPLLSLDGEVVSSSRIRREIGVGRMEIVRRLLGRTYAIRGLVQRGAQLGRTLGFPTANLNLEKYVYPAYGAYAGLVYYNEKKYSAMINIGIHPTKTIAQPRLEAYLLDFTGDLYGQILDVDLWHKLRDDCGFANLEELKNQLQKDLQNTCNYFAKVLS